MQVQMSQLLFMLMQKTPLPGQPTLLQAVIQQGFDQATILRTIIAFLKNPIVETPSSKLQQLVSNATNATIMWDLNQPPIQGSTIYIALTKLSNYLR